jgi:uncharacterized protein
LRTYRAGQAKLPAYLEDYAFLAHGLLRLHAATGDAKRLDQARALADRMIADFSDPKDGGFFATSGDHESLLARPKDPFDNVLPSGNSVAVRVLVALAAATGESRYLDAAGKTLGAFSGTLAQSPGSMPLMLVALLEYLDARPEADTPADAALTVAGPVGAGPRGLVTVTAEAAPEKAEATLTIAVRDGWHVYANPTGDTGVPPTRLTIDPGQGWAIERVEYPPGVVKTLASSQNKVALYEGKVKLVVRLKPDGDATGQAAADLKFTLHYQACNDRACLAPARQAVAVPWKAKR